MYRVMGRAGKAQCALRLCGGGRGEQRQGREGAHGALSERVPAVWDLDIHPRSDLESWFMPTKLQWRFFLPFIPQSNVLLGRAVFGNLVMGCCTTDSCMAEMT